MILTQTHKILLGAVNRLKRPTSPLTIATGASITGHGSTRQFLTALDELIADKQVETNEKGWVLPIEEE